MSRKKQPVYRAVHDANLPSVDKDGTPVQVLLIADEPVTTVLVDGETRPISQFLQDALVRHDLATRED